MSDPKPGPLDPGFVVEYSGLVRVSYRGDIFVFREPFDPTDMLVVPHGHYRAELRFVRVPDPEEPTR